MCERYDRRNNNFDSSLCAFAVVDVCKCVFGVVSLSLEQANRMRSRGGDDFDANATNFYYTISLHGAT